ncbi:hypothetical protein CC78DRAFT_546210 [Lojkania enalia]|uniref:Heterokaryon incompatibility domain-containing protein n=1 Tax=Lojkania enalia TaxID=147567 RepID=A0A9P4K555_9PLEO|nr:hypothetical protein CC78DRAFT_546210 [Didymosphaeria enalia]
MDPPHVEIVYIEEDQVDASSMHAHALSEKGKGDLFLHCHPGTNPSPSLDADSLFQDFRRWAPSVAQGFAPNSKDGRDFKLRLLNDINYEGDETSYIALSYCWTKLKQETPSRTVSPVGDLPFGWIMTVERFPLPISKWMFEAVSRERREGEGLWYDQVCINQEDEAEKTIAMGVMDLIYKNARSVIVTLDDILAGYEEQAFLNQYVPQMAISQISSKSPYPVLEINHPLRSFCERVLSSIWFERAWCAHEMRLGRSHIFLVPCRSREDTEAHSIIRFTGEFFLHLLSLAKEAIDLFPGLQARILSLHQLFVLKLQFHKQYNRPNYQAPLISEPLTHFIPTIAEIFRQKAGGNPRLPEHLRRLDANRDKTAIALSSANIPIKLLPSLPLQRPAIEDECLRQLLLIGIAVRDPVALCTTGPPLQLHDGSISWLCRPTSQDIGPCPQPIPLFSVTSPLSQSSDGRAEYVQSDLIFLGLPHHTQPMPSFADYVQQAKFYVDAWIQARIQSHPMWSAWQTPNHARAPAMKNIYIQTLACCLELGPWWATDVSKRISATTELVLDPEAIEFLFNPQLPLQGMVHSSHKGKFFRHKWLNFLSALITHGIRWASGATERSHGPLIVSLSSPPIPEAVSCASPQYHPVSATAKALIFAPFEHSKILLVAVPEVIKNTDYGLLPRGWILTPFNTFTGSGSTRSSSGSTVVNWTLQSKSIVFGETGFNDALARPRSQSQRCHRVYGPAPMRSPGTYG